MPHLSLIASSTAAAGLSWLAAPNLDIGKGIFYVLCLILCVAVHEFGHAFVADRLGDPMPRAQGRVTLNPIKHIDIFGTVLFPLVLAATGSGMMFGWGKPVEWTANPRYLTRRFSLRTSKLMVSVAGPGMNLVLAVLLSAVFIAMVRLSGGSESVIRGAELLFGLIQMNLLLMFFNLLPIPPLDGRSFLEFLPGPMAPVRNFLTQYGSLIFLGLLMVGPIFGGQSPLGLIMSPFNWLIGLYQSGLLSLVR